jgi:hypothetical protein
LFAPIQQAAVVRGHSTQAIVQFSMPPHTEVPKPWAAKNAPKGRGGSRRSTIGDSEMNIVGHVHPMTGFRVPGDMYASRAGMLE